MAKKKVLAGADFTMLSANFQKATLDLCAETYEATQEPPPKAELRELVTRADAHLAEYQEMVGSYDGGRLESLQSFSHHIESLTEFVDTLKLSPALKG